MQYGAYIAIAGIGLYAIFVGEIISIFNFMIDPTLTDFFEPESKILQFISIGVAPDGKEIWIKANWSAGNCWGYCVVSWYVICIYNAG